MSESQADNIHSDPSDDDGNEEYSRQGLLPPWLRNTAIAAAAIGVVGYVASWEEPERPSLLDEELEDNALPGETVDNEYRNTFFANIHDHDPRAVCVDRVGGSLSDLAERATGDPQSWDQLIEESPFSHWFSLAKSQEEVEDHTTGLSSLDMALDSNFSDMPPATNLVCRYNYETGEMEFIDSEAEIYPSGIPSQEAVSTMIRSTVGINRYGQHPEDGWDAEGYTSAVHLGNGLFVAPSYSTEFAFGTDTDEPLIDQVDSAELYGFELDPTPLDVDSVKDDSYVYFETDLADLPAPEIKGVEDLEPGMTLIVTGFDEAVLDNPNDRFFYRVVILDKYDDGTIVAATNVEDSGSYRDSKYHPHNGASGGAAFDIDGSLIGTISHWEEYFYFYYSIEDVSEADIPQQNKYLDDVARRLGILTPQEARDRDSYGTLDSSAIDAYVVIRPIPEELHNNPSAPNTPAEVELVPNINDQEAELAISE